MADNNSTPQSNPINQLRGFASRVLSSASNALKTTADPVVDSTKGFSSGDAGWTSYGGMGGSGMLGPAGAGQLNVGITRFRTTAEMEGAFTADDTIYSCTTLRAQTMANLTWKLRHIATGAIVEESGYKSDQDIADSTPLFRDQPAELLKYRALTSLLRKPNPYQTWHDFQALQEMYFDLTGNALTYKDNANGLGWPEFLWPLNPALVQPVLDPNEGLLGYYYQAGNTRLALDPDQVIHHKTVNPGSLFWGLSPIMAVAGVLDAVVAIDEYQRSFFNNGAVFSGLLYSDDTNFSPSPQEFRSLRSQVKEQFQGVRNHFRVAILTKGMKWQSIQPTQQDMGMIDWKKMGQDRIRQVYGVPKSKLGMQDDAQYNKLDAADRMFYKETIEPLAGGWARSTTEGLTQYYGYELFYDVPQFEDLLAQVEIAKGIDSLQSATLWEKRRSIKKVMGNNIVFEDDTDSPISRNGNGDQEQLEYERNRPQLHTIYQDGTPVVQLSAGKLVQRKQLKAPFEAPRDYKSEIIAAAKSAPIHTGVMVAFLLPYKEAQQLSDLVQSALDDDTIAESSDQLHITLAYMGDKDTNGLTPAAQAKLLNALKEFTKVTPAITGRITGVGRFDNETDGTYAYHAKFAAPGLSEMQSNLLDCIRSAGIEPFTNHDFNPHITLAYLPKDMPMPDIEVPNFKFTFNDCYLAWGDQRFQFPLAPS